MRNGLLWFRKVNDMGSTYDLGVIHETLGHDLGSSEFSPPDENVDVRSVLGEVYEGKTNVRYKSVCES